jgi:hypothetical protein
MEIALLYLTGWWCVLAEFDIGGDVPLCSAGCGGETWLFSACGVLGNVRYQNDAMGDSPPRYRLAVTYACRCAKSNCR